MARIELQRPARRPPMITLVPMVDVMTILLVFFMVTSTYLDLDMVPAVKQEDKTPAAAAPQPGQAGVLLVRISAEGLPVLQGQALTLEEFGARIAARIADQPMTQVVLLPSGEATMQAMIAVMDRATLAGVTRLRVIRLEARP